MANPRTAAPTAVRATANLPTSDEVALIMTGAGEPHEPTERDIRVYARSTGLRRISHLNPLYTPLHFLLLFPWAIPDSSLGLHMLLRLQLMTSISIMAEAYHT